MKRLIVLLICVCSCIPMLHAIDGCEQHMTREEFRAKQQAYITEKAGLTKEEAEKFFPIYFELQERKNQLNREGWEQFRKGKDDKTTEAQYEEILDAFMDARIASDRLEKTYFEKFKKILPSKKLFRVYHAEMSFNRDLVKGMHHPRGKGGPNEKGKK